MNVTEDRRKSTRYSISREANITVQGLQTSSVVQIINISTIRMGCSEKNRYKQGTTLHVKLKIFASSNDVFKESLTGQVIWLEELEGEKECSFGVEFDEVERSNPYLYAYVMGLGKFLFET